MSAASELAADYKSGKATLWASLVLLLFSALLDAKAGETAAKGGVFDNALLTWRPTRPKLVYDNRNGGAAACIIRQKDGTLLASVSSVPGDKSTEVVFIESTDGGRNWDRTFTAMVPAPHLVASDIAMGLMNDGRIVMICTQSLGENLGGGENRSGKPFPKLRRFIGRLPDGRKYQAYENYRIYTAINLAYSADRGRTWTVGPEVEYAPVLGAWTWTGGRPAQLADGTLVIPISGYMSPDDVDGIRQSCGVLRNNGDGGGWSFTLVARSDKNKGLVFSEPAMARLEDGRLVFMIRAQNRIREPQGVPDEEQRGLYHSISDDGGKTWSRPVRVQPGTHCSIVQLGDGRLLCGWHRPMRYAVSQDAGRNWTRPEPWFIGADSHQGTYTNVEYVDEETAVAMIRDEKRTNRLWACRLLAVVEIPEVEGQSLGSQWRFAPDPENLGLKEKWFHPGHDDSSWKLADLEGGWNDDGHPDYLGYGWYRKSFRVPQNLAEAEALHFLFQAVDEEAEIWLNGRKVFEHTCAATGLSPEELWTKPFSFKAGGALDRSGDNVLAVRVYNRAGMGGIWKPVHLVNNKDALTTSTLTMAIQHANPAD